MNFYRDTAGTSLALGVIKRKGGDEKMNRARLILSLLLLGGLLGYTTAPASAQAVKVKGVKPGVIEATPINKAGTYCHLKFPAIKPSTYNTAKPELKDPSSGDIIDYYGPCDHDPLSYEEQCAQKARQFQGYCD